MSDREERVEAGLSPDSTGGRSMEEMLGQIAACLQGAERILITAHVNPDGDAFGSALALALGLDRLGKRARVFSDHAVPERFRSILPADRVEVVAESSPAPGAEEFDACVLLDTSEPERAGELRSLFTAGQGPTICLDHHRLQEREYPFTHHLVCTAAPATGCLVLRLLDALGVALDREIGHCLWLAIATDTGWFRFANTTAVALRDAARLAELGIEPEELFATVYGAHTVARQRVYGHILADLQTDLDGRLVWSVVGRDLLARHGVTIAELDGVVDALKSIRTARVAALISERGDGFYKTSLRAIGDATVEEIARSFGGGGHAKAAGFGFHGTLDELLVALRSAVDELAAPAR